MTTWPVCLCRLLMLLWGVCFVAPCAEAQTALRICFYNVENLFDTDDDPLTADDEFTPSGVRHWTSRRLQHKLEGLTRVVSALGAGRPPALIGLAEVENDSVMQRWLRATPMWRMGYEYVMTDSRDVRGIDVALLYQPVDFRLLGHESVRVPLRSAELRPTRDVLHAWGRIAGGDTLDVLVCHLPSRLGGTRASASHRRAAHVCLRSVLDSLLSLRGAPHLVVMGDFNDPPSTRSLVRNLRLSDPSEGRTLGRNLPDAKTWTSAGRSDAPRAASGADTALFDLMIPLERALRRGTISVGSHKYQGEWNFLDHFLVNGRLLSAGSGVSDVAWCVDTVGVFHLPFMLTDDVTHLGCRPLRTYYGYRYEAGFSDHLPIFLDLKTSSHP